MNKLLYVVKGCIRTDISISGRRRMTLFALYGVSNLMSAKMQKGTIPRLPSSTMAFFWVAIDDPARQVAHFMGQGVTNPF